LWQTPAAVLALVVWLTTPPTNLADIARREALRRQLTDRSIGSFTNADLPPTVVVMTPEATPPPVAGAGEDEPPVTAGAAAATAGAPGSAAAAPTTAEDRKNDRTGEEYWRKRMEDARAVVERNQVLLDAMQARINALNTDVVNTDDPFQQGQLRQQLARALSELDKLKRDVDAGNKAIKDIQTEARKQRIPPGWVR
jgi:hypothetical protein